MATSLVNARLAVDSHSMPMENSREVPAISYDAPVLEALRRVAQAAFDANQQPVTGILLGRRTPSGVSVTAWLPVKCSLASREANLSRAIELGRLEYPTEAAIGWFRSKHQGEARLSTEDIESVSALIPGVPVLSLVLRASSQRPLRVAAYLPLADVAPAGERPLQEFYIEPNQEEDPDTALAPMAAMRPVAVGDSARLSPGERFRASMERMRWAVPAGLLVIVGIVAMSTAQLQGDDPSPPFAVLAKSATAAPPKPMLEPLRVSANGKQWQVSWDTRPVADHATLLITRDGQKQSIALTARQYAGGTYALPMALPENDMEILLRRKQGEQAPMEIRMRIVASATTLPPTVNPATLELDRLKLELQAERLRRQRLMELFDAQNKGR